MFRVIIQSVPSDKLHHAVSVLAAVRLAQNPKLLADQNTVQGDWMNADLSSDPNFNNIVKTLQTVKASFVPGARVLLEIG